MDYYGFVRVEKTEMLKLATVLLSGRMLNEKMKVTSLKCWKLRKYGTQFYQHAVKNL